MAKINDTVIRIRVPKEIKLRMQAEAEKYNVDISKICRWGMECFLSESKCLLRKRLKKG